MSCWRCIAERVDREQLDKAERVIKFFKSLKRAGFQADLKFCSDGLIMLNIAKRRDRKTCGKQQKGGVPV